MLKNLIFKESGYVYVFHSGVEILRFMGMTELAYEKVKGNFEVLCFCNSDSRETTYADLEEEFLLDKTDRNISSKATKEESLACADTFFNKVVPNMRKFIDGFEFVFLINKKNPLKSLYTNSKWCSVVLNAYKDMSLGLDSFETKSVLGLNINILEEFVTKKTVISLKTLVNRMYWGKSDYILVMVKQSNIDSECLMDVRNVVLSDSLAKEVDSYLADEISATYSYMDTIYLM